MCPVIPNLWGGGRGLLIHHGTPIMYIRLMHRLLALATASVFFTLPEIIARLRQRGFACKTVTDMMTGTNQR